ncbi:hypothetical protein PanWU01x14_278070 [Parasponia andersonii]|uniref:Uncharacterized protein n=1 Tax=Parasponia andersonii TaxID=3476 RepID=A0A2P5B2B0_PARAD|nr:hypothetical protein PanWU01x14_278070 [Parasponia andersonii]
MRFLMMKSDSKINVLFLNIISSRDDLIKILDMHCRSENKNSSGVCSKYNFLYVPMDFKNVYLQFYFVINIHFGIVSIFFRGHLLAFFFSGDEVSSGFTG